MTCIWPQVWCTVHSSWWYNYGIEYWIWHQVFYFTCLFVDYCLSAKFRSTWHCNTCKEPQFSVCKLCKTALLDLEIVAILQEVDASSQGTKPVKGVSAKGKGGGSTTKKGKDTPSGKGGAGDIGVDDFPMPQKPPSTMKKRGEEDLDSKYIGL